MRPAEQQFIAFISEACKGNEDAVNFLVGITNVAHFFDDLYDGDVVRSQEDIVNALWATMVAIPRNEFYRKFFAELQPVVASAVTNWRIANTLERAASSEIDLRVAFIVRSSYADLIQQVAMICGGPEWAAQVGVAARRLCHSEPWKDYMKSVEVLHGVVQPTEATGPQPGDDRVGAGERGNSAGADRPWPRAVRVGEGERATGPADAGPDTPAATADR